MIRRGKSLFLIIPVVLGIIARGFCYQSEVIDISGAKYFSAVKEALEKAEKSIYLVMFTIESPDRKKGQSQSSGQAPFSSKVSQLIDALIAAKNRGVEVEVILDQNVDFVHRGHPSDWDVEIKSTQAYRRLKEAGIKVNYDDPARYTHAKAVVIDKRIVILGSTNWSESSFTNSIETDVLINSAELAEEILSYLKTIKIDESAGREVENVGPSTRVDREFLENPKFISRMIRAHAERDFDVYLYLLWKFGEKNRGSPQGAGTVSISYEDAAKYLGIYEGWTVTDYRRQIIRALRELEQRYKLIKFDPRWGKEAEITLLEIVSSPAAPRNDTEGYVELPNDYFDFGWNRELSFRAKFCYFINLAYTDSSDSLPFWSESIPTITKQFNVYKEVISSGMAELRRKKLIEVKYAELNGRPYDDKVPKSYRLLKLYDLKELRLKIKAIEDKYGKEAYSKAKKYAEIVFEENNPQIVEDIILKIKQYGEEIIKKAFDIVTLKNTDNPKKSYAYVVGIIKNTERIIFKKENIS